MTPVPRRLALLGVAVAFVFVLSSMSLPQAEAQAENWWNANWDYRVPIIVTGSVGNDNVISFVLDNADNLGGHMGYENFQDLRFFSGTDNGPLPYWIERTKTTHVAGDNATIYLRQPTLDDNIMCYYGNDSAAPKENGDNVFLLWDNFDGTTIDTGKWVEDDHVNNYITQNELLTITSGPTAWGDGIFTYDNFLRPFTAEFDLRHTVAGYGVHGIKENAQAGAVSYANFNYGQAPNPTAPDHDFYFNGGYVADTSPYTTNIDYTWRYNVYDIGCKLFRTRDDTEVDMVLQYSELRDSVGARKVGFGLYSWSAGIDNLRVRSMEENGPTMLVGVEESSPSTLDVSTTSSENIIYENVGLVGSLDTLDEAWADSFFQFRVNGTVSWDNNDYDNVRLTSAQAYGILIDNNGVGLVPNTLYDYRAYVIDDTDAEANGATLTFTTDNSLIISSITYSEALVDKEQDVAGSSAVFTTTIGITVFENGGNTIPVGDVDIFIYDNSDVLEVDNATPDSVTVLDSENRRFDYSYNPTDAIAGADLGTFDLRVYAQIANSPAVDNWDNDQFTVDDLEDTNLVNQENLAAHRQRVYGISTRESGGVVVLTSGVRVDSNDGSVAATVTGTAFENTYYPSADGTVYFNLETAELDGKTATLAYFVPNFSPQITNLTVDNVLIDRDHDDPASTVELSTVVTLWVFDNDGRDEIVDVWLASRDNENVVYDNDNITSTAILVDENTSAYTITINPDDNLPDNGLGPWDVDIWAWDDYDTYQHTSWGDNTYLDSMEDNTWSNGEYSQVWFTDGIASMKISTAGAGTEDMFKFQDLTYIDNISFEANSEQTINLYIDNVSVWSVVSGGEENIVIDVSTIVGERELRFRTATGGVPSYLYVDKMVLHSFGDNLFRVSDLTSTATFSPTNPYYRWLMDAVGTITSIENDNTVVCDNIWYLDTTESQNVAFTIDDNWVVDNYEINNTLPGDSAEISVIMWWNETLDGEYLENYTVHDNYQFQVNIYWEENFQPVDDNHIENYENWVATFYFADYEPQSVPLTSSAMMVYAEYEPRTLRVWDSDNNYFRTYRTTTENVDVYMVADNTAGDLYYYTITLDDPSGQYGPPDGYVIIYTFEEGTPVYINDTYWAGTNTITAYLIFGTQYNLRLGSDTVVDLDWGVFDADANTSQTIIPSAGAVAIGAPPRPITGYLTWYFAWADNETLDITYVDSSENTNWVAVYILDSRGNRLWFDNNASDSFSVQWTGGDNENFYTITLEINHESAGTVSVSEYSGGLWGGQGIPQPSWSPPALNMLGEPPVPWGLMLVAGLFVVIVMSFGPGSIGIGGIFIGAVGFFLNYMHITAIENEVLVMIITLGFLIQVYESRRGGYG